MLPRISSEQSLEQIVSALFPRIIMDLTCVTLNINEVDMSTLLKLLENIPVAKLKEHFKLTGKNEFTKALTHRGIKISERQKMRLQSIPEQLFPCLVLASKNAAHLAEVLNVDDQWLGGFIKQKYRVTGYSTYKLQLLQNEGSLNPLLEKFVNEHGTTRNCIKLIAKEIGCNESDTYSAIIRCEHWKQLVLAYSKERPAPAAMDLTFLSYLRDTESDLGTSDKSISPLFLKTELDIECPMFNGELDSLSTREPIFSPAEAATEKDNQKQSKWIDDIAVEFDLAADKVKSCINSSRSAQEFRELMGRDLENKIRLFFDSKQIIYFELKTGLEINSLILKIKSQYRYEDGELILKNNLSGFAGTLGITDVTLMDYLQKNSTSFMRIIIEDLTAPHLFAILKKAKGNKPKISLDAIARKFSSRGDKFQLFIQNLFNISLTQLANTLLPAINNLNFAHITETYTRKIGDMDTIERQRLIDEMRRLAASAPSLSIFSHDRNDVENPRAIKAPRIMHEETTCYPAST